jgi:hypothetical protein
VDLNDTASIHWVENSPEKAGQEQFDQVIRIAAVVHAAASGDDGSSRELLPVQCGSEISSAASNAESKKLDKEQDG